MKKDRRNNTQEHSNFVVKDDEVIQMIDILSKDFDTDEVRKLSKTWIRAVMSQPYHKNKLERRPFEYSNKKLSDYLTWREKSKITNKITLHLSHHNNKINRGHGDNTSGRHTTCAAESLSSSSDTKKVATTVSPGSLYWFGTDNEGSPNLWYRADRTLFEKVNVNNEMEWTSVVIQAALDIMPENTHNFNFVILFDKYDPLKAMRKPNLGPAFVKTFMMSYPDRLKRGFMVTGTLGHIFYKMAKGIAPASIMDKVTETRSREVTAQLLVKEGILNDENEVPDFMGGTFIHDNEIITNYSAMIKGIRLAMFGGAAAAAATSEAEESSSS
jgi:hypothetical protein